MCSVDVKKNEIHIFYNSKFKFQIQSEILNLHKSSYPIIQSLNKRIQTFYNIYCKFNLMLQLSLPLIISYMEVKSEFGMMQK